MTERQMWDRQADAWECAEHVTGGAYATAGVCYGICAYIFFNAGANIVASARYRLDSHDPFTRYRLTDYWWPPTAEGALERAAFCRKMALECADEEAARD